MFLIPLIIIILLSILYFTGIEPMQYWRKHKVPHLRAWPYFGNRISQIFGRRTMLDVLNKHYQAFSGRRYFGFYNMSTPVLILRDPELIKQITVENFDSFPEHRRFIPDEVDRLWSKNLFAMRGNEEWKRMRATLTPFFTGHKLKMMFESMKICSRRFTNYFLKEQLVTVELKDAFTRFANDVIANTVFGITCNSLQNRTEEFYMKGRVISNVTGWRNFSQILHLLSPTLSKILKYPFYPEEERIFFENMVNKIVNRRENKRVNRVDVIQLLIEAKKKRGCILTNEDITAQVMIFFFAGFETVSTMLCYTCYELAINRNVQDNLYKEIKEALDTNNGDIPYEILKNMSYLGKVLEESLRKWPPFGFIDRCSIKPFTIKEKQSVHLETGTICIIPVLALHRDPKYYPDPEKFDPERFSMANKKDITNCPYLPFGIGQRTCIGSSFALLEARLIIAEILSQFEIVPVEETEIPLVMNKRRNNAIPSNGFRLGLKPRK